jgi:hypothetical protein
MGSHIQIFITYNLVNNHALPTTFSISGKGMAKPMGDEELSSSGDIIPTSALSSAVCSLNG